MAPRARVVALEASKEQPPYATAARPRGGLTLDSLGVEFDIELNRMRLLPAKCIAYTSTVREILQGGPRARRTPSCSTC
jgi:hypothetical protein